MAPLPRQSQNNAIRRSSSRRRSRRLSSPRRRSSPTRLTLRRLLRRSLSRSSPLAPAPTRLIRANAVIPRARFQSPLPQRRTRSPRNQQ